MKDLIKKIIKWKLRLLANLYLKLKNIEIIAITGSAGKTTTKKTIAQIIPSDVIYVPKESYNTEYGLPLALFQEKTPDNPKNILAWAGVLMRMVGKLFLKAPYKRIALEYGADKPGDISYLTGFAKPHIAVITSVLPVHLEGFENVDAVALEKSKLIEYLDKNDFAILNFDDLRVHTMANRTRAKVLSIGKADVDVKYSNAKYNEHGMVFDANWKGNDYQINIPVVAPQLIPSYLSAFVVGLLLGMDPKELVKKLTHIVPERGRMNVLAGLAGSTIIDDSYNSNPESAKAALQVLYKYSGHKIAVLGSMNELGDYTKKGHEEVGEMAARIADEVLIVGKIAEEYMYPAVAKKMNNKFVQKFETSDMAGKYLVDKVKKGDVLLFKGSQNGVFMEEAIKYVLAEPKKAADVLVRQGPMWQNKKGKHE